MTEPKIENFSVSEEKMIRATKVGPNASIVDIRLIDHSARAHELTDQDPTLKRNRRGSNFVRDEQFGGVRVFVLLGADVAYDTEESKANPPVSVSATYCLSYTVNDLESFDDDDLAAFAEVNGLYNAWPFWRELYYSVTGRMGLRPSALPTLRIKREPPAIPQTETETDSTASERPASQ